MSVIEIDSIYEKTETYILSLKTSFLDKHLANPLAAPDDYDYDVKSYCILCHAAFEDYAETISLKVMNYSINNYILARKLSESIISLLHFKSSGLKYFNKLEDDAPLVNCFDYFRKELEEVKSKFSIEITQQNHGVSVKYIRQLLMPVGIDIPNDVNLLNSLKVLSNERGFYAHKFLVNGILRKSIEPDKAKDIVEDCLKICEDLREKAKARIA